MDDMNRVFENSKCQNFEGLKSWDVPKVADVQSIFYGCNALENLPSWYQEQEDEKDD